MVYDFSDILHAHKGNVWARGDKDYDLVLKLSEFPRSGFVDFDNGVKKVSDSCNVFPLVAVGDTVIITGRQMTKSLKAKAKRFGLYLQNPVYQNCGNRCILQIG